MQLTTSHPFITELLAAATPHPVVLAVLIATGDDNTRNVAAGLATRPSRTNRGSGPETAQQALDPVGPATARAQAQPVRADVDSRPGPV